jgi:hypothetical protein
MNVYGVTKSPSAAEQEPLRKMSVLVEAPHVPALVIRQAVTTRTLARGVPTNKSAGRNSLGANQLEDPADVLVMKPPVLALLKTNANGALSLTNVPKVLKVATPLVEAAEAVEVLVKT